jgi:hypothetical protein
MLEDQPRNRGGRPRKVLAPTFDDRPAAVVEAGEAPTPKVERRRRPSTGGHAYKLSAPSREGETRRWVNDEGNRIANMKELGYEFVSDTAVKTDQPGSRIARRVGTQANGAPLHAYLMETPDQLYQQGVDEKEAKNSLVDQAIEAGRDFTGRLTSQESYGHGSIKAER